MTSEISENMIFFRFCSVLLQAVDQARVGNVQLLLAWEELAPEKQNGRLMTLHWIWPILRGVSTFE